ncbi:MAG: hypothetical protein ABH813_00875 [Patescibacteria group bacterium]
MQFTVPQFIERESKIFGPLTFIQFIYIGSGGTVCLLLYFSFAKTNFLLFLLATAIIMSLTGSLAFLRIGGRSLPTMIKNFFFFTLAPKIYLWRRKNVPPRMIKKTEEKTEPEGAESSILKLAEKSQLKNLSNILETKK